LYARQRFHRQAFLDKKVPTNAALISNCDDFALSKSALTPGKAELWGFIREFQLFQVKKLRFIEVYSLDFGCPSTIRQVI
jgi:hypothetical protein